MKTKKNYEHATGELAEVTRVTDVMFARTKNAPGISEDFYERIRAENILQNVCDHFRFEPMRTMWGEVPACVDRCCPENGNNNCKWNWAG